MKISIAVSVCGAVVILHFFLGNMLFGWENGGGAIPILIMGIIVLTLWNLIMSNGNPEIDKNHNEEITTAIKHPPMLDYFAKPTSTEESVIRGIKGNFRRTFVSKAIEDEGLDSVPGAWKEHSISEALKNMLQSQNPSARGGEDLPDLEDGEVEIARLTLVDSVHGEVTSLRARPGNNAKEILFRMVDEYETDFKLPEYSSSKSLLEEQVISMFKNSIPNPTDTECEMEFQSFFYLDLNAYSRELMSAPKLENQQSLNEFEFLCQELNFNGDAEKICLTGEIFLDGDGRDKNYTLAAKFFHMAAEEGHSRAQHNLALM